MNLNFKNNSKKTTTVGIDVGSTTVKIVAVKNGEVVFERYQRHFSQIKEKIAELLGEAAEVIDGSFSVALSGSAGLGLSESAHIPFIQEVFATSEVVKNFEPDTSCVIELGGEDAKIIFYGGGVDERMNGSCAGGTGAFIDQMSTLLNITADELDELSLKHNTIYPIASRCGVFAKTDIQALLNQGASKEDIAASIYQAVVNQTIAGLAQGRRIRGKVLFLGGPLYYNRGLRERFVETLKLSENDAVFPDYGRYAVALGCAMYADGNGLETDIPSFIERMCNAKSEKLVHDRLEPLFNGEEEYSRFRSRHDKAVLPHADIDTYSGAAYIGIDCGSTTTKLVLITENNEILYSYYASNRGDPVELVRSELINIYDKCKDRIKIKGSAVTGYGEELIKQAFGVEYGLVETVAHYTAARYFLPDVDFIIDIGGQDIKCFRIRNGAVDSIMLNEACSSGCGSFLETFARALGYSASDFASLGLFAPQPVNLGSRCTVFMNSSVKQSQKEGASVGDISAGLSVSVVKNAIYKVIRASSASELGRRIVVQGGTFASDSVLRAFERELGCNVIRPTEPGLMGAFGAAMYSKKCPSSRLISRDALSAFTHTSKTATCGGCQNRCCLTINTFDGKKYITGNKCEKGAGLNAPKEKLPNIYEYKREYLLGLKSLPVKAISKGGEGIKMGLPLGLGMYELLPLWYVFFKSLGFEVITSGMSNRRTYEKGQFSIPSDTVCYPAKLMHGHIMKLLNSGCGAVFYPCLSYNIDEKESDNHYNCPVVAYYSELLNGNIEELKDTKFIYPHLNINDKKELSKELYDAITVQFPGRFKPGEIKAAVKLGFEEYRKYMDSVKKKGAEALEYARKNGTRIMILAGRPYHIDNEINHGIDKLAVSLGFTVVSEDSVCELAGAVPTGVLNQWTYHARLYRAAQYAAEHDDTELVQLVSFGCGVDAITTDEVRSILEGAGKFYTQLKIDEITNLGAVKIRLRSLLGALDMCEPAPDKTETENREVPIPEPVY